MGENIHELLYLCECGNYRHYKNGKFCCQCGREINRERKNALAEQIETLLEQWELENGRNYIKSSIFLPHVVKEPHSEHLTSSELN